MSRKMPNSVVWIVAPPEGWTPKNSSDIPESFVPIRILSKHKLLPREWTLASKWNYDKLLAGKTGEFAIVVCGHGESERSITHADQGTVSDPPSEDDRLAGLSFKCLICGDRRSTAYLALDGGRMFEVCAECAIREIPALIADATGLNGLQAQIRGGHLHLHFAPISPIHCRTLFTEKNVRVWLKQITTQPEKYRDRAAGKIPRETDWTVLP